MMLTFAPTGMSAAQEMEPMLAAEKAKAQEELAKMGEVDFSSPGLIARFLGLFKKKKEAANESAAP